MNQQAPRSSTTAPADGATPPAPSAFAPEAEPVPPRFWWFKRLWPLVAAWLLLMIGLRIWWGYEAQRRFDQRITAYRAAGQPVILEEFRPPAVPEDENAAPLWRQAAISVIPQVGPHHLDSFTSSAYAAAYPAALDALIAQNQAALQLAEEAAAKPRADWGVAYASPVLSMRLPSLAGQRSVAKLLAVAVRQANRRQDHALAVARVHQLLEAAQDVDGAPPTLISHLVRVALEALTINAIQDVVPTLEVHADDSPSAAAADRAAVEHLAHRLLDAEEYSRGMQQALFFERMMQADTVQCLFDGTFTVGALTGRRGPIGAAAMNSVASPIFPLLRLDAVYMLDWTTRYAAAAATDVWPQAQRIMPSNPTFGSRYDRLVRHPLSSFLLPSLSRTVELHLRGLAQRRMAGLALALRLYQLDYGDFPETLDLLVPEYIPTIPPDPFRADGGPFGYLPHDAEPRLYSIGSDGVDDGGAYFPQAYDVDADQLDTPFFLTAARPQFRTPAPRAGARAAGDASNPGDESESGDASRPTSANPTSAPGEFP